jgi:hypothetical protein
VTPLYVRISDDLTRVFSTFGVRAHIAVTDDGVTVHAADARALMAALAFVEGGSRVPFVRSLLRCGDDVLLRGDEGRHLCRALEDIARTKNRNDAIDRGRIPGALSGVEAMRLSRKHPHLFGAR